jgi:hypothetical protein
MSPPRESRSAAPFTRLAAASRETINRIARPETRGMSSSTLEVAARMTFILAKRPPGGARPCCSASPPKRWICCSHWPRRSNSTSATNSSARSRPSLEAKRQAGEIGEGSVHRVGRAVQRRFFDPPEIGESKYRRP